jgi:biopolymer transport protein ExbB
MPCWSLIMNLIASPFESIEHTVIWLLILFSVATWGLALLKGVQFTRLKTQDRKFHKHFWAASSLDSAAELAHSQPGAAARVARAGYAAIQVPEDAQAAYLSQAINHQDRLERALRQQIVRERRSLESGLAILASIGSTSPFIGLFGTVWGIMSALKGISAAGSASLETVAGPIGAALVATGVGIAVAVPAVLVYNYFLRRLKLTAADLDDFAHDFYSLAQKNAFRVLLHPVLSKSGATVAGQKVKEAS